MNSALKKQPASPPTVHPAHLKELEKIARKKSARETKEMGSHMTEKEIDKMLKDSFPASDPPGTY